MSEARAEVRNAADPRQVRAAARRAKRRETRWRDALRVVLASPEGRLVFGELEYGVLARLGIYASVTRGAVGVGQEGMIWFNAGRQDAGHELQAEILATDPDGYLTMEAEARALAASDARETAASHAATDTPEAAAM